MGSKPQPGFPSPTESTPSRKGTAQIAEFNADVRVKNKVNNELVEMDLEKKITPGIMYFLKALLGLVLMETTGKGPESPGAREDIDATYNAMLADAVAFCNNTDDADHAELKQHLETYCGKALEKDRYQPFSGALNAIQKHFRGHAYTHIPVPERRAGEEEVIYLPNDPETITSEYMYDDAHRKPDIIGVFAPYMRERYPELKDYSFEDLAEGIANGTIKSAGLFDTTGTKKTNKTPDKKPMKWIDVQQTWELKVRKVKKDSFAFQQKMWSADDITKAFDGTLAQEQKRTNKRKPDANEDAADASTGSSSKKLRSSTARSVHLPFTSIPVKVGEAGKEDTHDIDPDMQCAFYGLERLCAEWFITHCTVILLTDSDLSVRYYDAEGCVESFSFDILEHLPVFVLMVMIFQRFSPEMWGLAQRDASKMIIDESTFYLEPQTAEDKVGARFQLFGRRSFTAAASSDPSADACTLFCKSSWAESTRTKEPDIINIAHARAKELLPGKYSEMVTKHIPEVVKSRVYNEALSTTATFRLFMELVGFTQLKKGDIKKRARVKVLQTTHRLKPITKLKPSDFWKVFWDINRCSYVSWKIGIAQSDISLNNMMYYERDDEKLGVLNDYDLAAVMEPGARFPDQSGWQRTGTIPFMAIDLLEKHNGEIKRFYRYELESSAWCLTFHMLSEVPSDWLSHNFVAVARAKSDFFIHIPSTKFKAEWEPFVGFLQLWLFDWCNIRFSRAGEFMLKGKGKNQLAFLKELDMKAQEASYMRTATTFAKNVEVVDEIDVLRDTSWIDVQPKKSE